jgi:hypothetical protein
MVPTPCFSNFSFASTVNYSIDSSDRIRTLIFHLLALSCSLSLFSLTQFQIVSLLISSIVTVIHYFAFYFANFVYSPICYHTHSLSPPSLPSKTLSLNPSCPFYLLPLNPTHLPSSQFLFSTYSPYLAESFRLSYAAQLLL